jgi:DNA helicase-2/ATP-dependent DNA helicase PcrA
MAVLVRAAFQMREFEDRFLTLGIPYRVIGGPRFYERAEIRDAMAYMRLIAQGDDDLAFERIVNRPKRGIGDASVQALFKFARGMSIPLLQAAREIAQTDEVPPKARKALGELAANFARWTEVSKQIPHTELAEMVLDESGYTDALKNEKSADAPGRLDNLKELVRSMEQFESLAGFLEHVSLVMELENNESEDRVNLMTLHGAKGLEFDTVFLPGWEEGLFPSQRTMDESGMSGLEEERRLAYVGITRAKKRARVSFAANRRVKGMWQSSLPSRFINEIPEEHVETTVDEGFYGGYVGFRDNAPNAGNFGSTYDSPGWRRAQANRANAGGSRTRPPLIEAQAWTVQTSDPDSSQYTTGDRIFHQKFGYGRVTMVEGNKLTVNFDKAGEKKVIDQFVTRA